MKNLSLVLASLVLFAGVSFASPIAKKGVKQEKAKTEKTEKKETKKTEKKEVKKTETKKAADKK